MEMDDCIKRYCTGCGLCESLQKGKLAQDSKGYSHPESVDEAFSTGVCPASGIQSKRLSTKSIWGKSENVYLGWSENPEIRQKASSGGVLTTVACYLLDHHIVDGIIQVHRSSDCAYATETVISTTKEEVEQSSGSRYAISHPLNCLGKLDHSKKYCLIAKPCDISAFRNYVEMNPEVNAYIPICMSFFCMGLPSDDAQKKLLSKLECPPDVCKSLDYRGNGWPGFATAKDQQGNQHRITYDESWGKILGRDLMPYCRYCIDGIGEEADIACGDAWYIKDGHPDFDEHEGRNVIFARTRLGDEILNKSRKDGYLHLEDFPDCEDYLPVIQHSQYMRRASLPARIRALHLMRKPCPKYAGKVLKFYRKHISLREDTRTFLGMVKRIHQGKY